MGLLCLPPKMWYNMTMKTFSAGEELKAQDLNDNFAAAVGSAPGLVHLHTESFSAVSSVSIDSVFSSTYDNYRIIFVGTLSATEGDLCARMRASGTDATTTNYAFFLFAQGVNNTSYNQVNNASDTRWIVGRVGSMGTSSCSFDLFSPVSAARTTFHSQNYGDGDTTGFAQVGSGSHTLSNSYDGITIFPGGHNMTGTIHIYGYSEGGN